MISPWVSSVLLWLTERWWFIPAVESIVDALVELTGGNRVLLAALMSSIAAASTTLGALPALVVKYKRDEPRSLEKLINAGLGFSSGVMLVTSFTGLLLPSVEGGGLLVALTGLLLGALLVAVVNELVPHEHFLKGFEGPAWLRSKAKASWLVAFAIILHNIPEGFSIGVASAYQVLDGFKVGLAISLQDVPEGLAVALPVLAITGSKKMALLVAFLSGLSELLVAVPTATVFTEASEVLYLGLSFASGAMIYVVSHEALPESHRAGREKLATVGFFLGFILMLCLDVALG
ncbi:MAG: ZIP family metal transporter [Desulfurococcaceae archaeon]